jgi:HK97 family phage prohead protease
MRTVERRFCETRVNSAGGPLTSTSPGIITGYAAVANSLSEDLGGFKECVANGAFRRSLQSGADVRALINHDPNLIIGRTNHGTLRLLEDPHGLYMSCDVCDTSYGRDLITNVRNQNISQMSFAFTVDDDGEDWIEEDDPETGERMQVRILRSVSLIDISPVVYPAYAATSVSAVDPAVLALGRSHSHRQLFPEGIPAEVRSRLGNAVLDPKAQESRRRLFSMFV